MQRAAHGHVHLLETAADPEEGLAPLHAGPDEREGDGVPRTVEGPVCLGRVLAVFLRVHVRPPAGEKETVEGLQ